MSSALLPRLATAEAASHLRFGVGGEAAQFGPLWAVSGGRGTPLDTVWHDGTLPPSTDELAQAEAFCAERGQTVTLHLLSHAAPELVPLLSARGYVLHYVLHVYIHDLRSLPAAAALSVREEPDAEAWAQLSAQGFGPGTLGIMRRVGGLAGTRRFVAQAAGQNVGTAAFAVQDGIAAFHGTSTLPDFRVQGVQTALLAHRLQVAAAEGADLASVFVTPGSGSERNVQRAGFRLAGMRLTFSLPR